MGVEIIVTVIAIVVLIVLSGFFSGSETALTGVSRARMHMMEREGSRRAAMVNRLLEQPERIIGTVLLGNNLANILASSLTTSLLIGLFGDAGVAYATLGLTLIVVIFAEVLPKTYALAFSERFSLAIAPVMQVLIVIFRPFTVIVASIVQGILKLTPTTKDDNANILSAHEEIRGTIDLQAREGSVEKRDAHMLGGVLDLGAMQVEDVMVHRTKMDTVNADLPIEKIIDEVLKTQYTRVPIWRDEPDNIVGVLHTKDMLSAIAKQDWDIAKLSIESFSSEPWFVPDTTTLKEQLNQFLKKKSQMAFVVDEYGEVQGLVALEDILEEIVGQIEDEHDEPERLIRPQADGTVNVDGVIPIRDLNRYMDWHLPEDEATTVAGLVIHEAQTIPEPGQTFTFYGYRFEVLRKSRNKISALRITPIAFERPIPDTAGDKAR